METSEPGFPLLLAKIVMLLVVAEIVSATGFRRRQAA